MMSALALGASQAAPPLAQGRPSVPARGADAQALVTYFQENGPKLMRAKQGLFAYPSIAPTLPSTEYSADLWDWDTMWTTRGLFRLAEVTGDDAFRDLVAEHARGSLFNFFDHQSPEGRLPIIMQSTDPDANRFPFNQPERNQAKPVMAQMALVIADATGDAGWFAPLYDRLVRFHQSWLAHNMTDAGLLVWSNDVAIGNDNDPTTFCRPPFSSANLLLNCLYHQDLQARLTLAERLSRPAAEQAELASQISALGDAIRRECWDPRDEFFYTVDIQVVDRRAELITNVPQGMATSWRTLPLRLQVFTGFLPMWCGVATSEQAAAMVARNWAADDRLRANHGVRTLSDRETMYSLEFTSNPSNWLGPVWVVSNYFVWRALKAYGFTALADEMADKTIRLLAGSLRTDGSLNEYYHPDTGQPLSHKGFMNWNLLVLEMI
ncbi:trehalase family glycosidase [Croceibacterium sp. TMG7-5b_MA50]|uniref:MGH1-like glycoside hydrolase domain-containing protein n=1 Tax=Croceibacterium sp. TMG7-5b_MA50 TaxID=3121290 RepID=UPI0032219DD1